MLVKSDIHHPTTPAKHIELNGKFFALVSPEDFEEINRFRWYAKKSGFCIYACRGMRKDGRVIIIRMHRQIARTPADMICHHKNGNTLDNRRYNLENMVQFDHIKMHSWR